ncbi:MAG: hypothetical protein H0V49_03310 [Nocardioidaceae bacterium]|nr:hypothetical protein [Nocardioidaceae bacterium]
MNINEHLAREVIRERTKPRLPTQRPVHPRAARVLRGLADRIDRDR